MITSDQSEIGTNDLIPNLFLLPKKSNRSSDPLFSFVFVFFIQQ